MSKYFTPGVYIEQAPNVLGVSPIAGDSELVGGFMGVAQRGPVGVPKDINSWGAYLDIYATGMASPFLATSELAYAVYGFFQNGGTRCYVMRTAHTGDVVIANNATSSVITIPGGATLTALDEGTWGNNLKIRVSENLDNASNFDITITLSEVVVESYINVSNTYSSTNYWVSAIAYSKYITGTGILVVTDTEVEQVVTPVYSAFSGGQDGLDVTFVDADYIGATGLINNFDAVVDINLISIPGETSDTIIEGLLDYCDKRKYIYAVLDSEFTETVSSAILTAKALRGYGSFVFPWIKVIEPLSTTGLLHECPPSGHVQGVMARIARNRGIWKSPAGTEAFISGAVDTVMSLTLEDTDKLNPVGVICIVPKVNYGIVVWGAKAVNGESYTAHILLDQYIKKAIFNGTQPFVFEPNVPATWMSLSSYVESFLSSLWQQGGLVGTEAKDAYYVKCDESNNTEETVRAGYLYCEVGYKRPGVAEFIVFRFSHEISK